MKLIKIGVIIGLAVVVLIVVIDLFTKSDVNWKQIAYIAGSAAVVLVALLRGIQLARPDSKAQPSKTDTQKKGDENVPAD